MLDTPTISNIADFKQRYLGVFGWLHTNKHPVYISSVNSRQVVFTDSEGAEFYAAVGGGAQFEFAPVVRGWYATPTNTYYMTRVPARQWKRGIAEENTHIALSTAVNYSFHGDQWKAAVFDVLKHIDHTGPTVFSKHFAKIVDKLYIYNQAIGVFINDSKVQLTSDLFRQEFSDVVRRKNLGIDVV